MDRSIGRGIGSLCGIAKLVAWLAAAARSDGNVAVGVVGSATDGGLKWPEIENLG